MKKEQDPRSGTLFEAVGVLAILAAMGYLITRGVLLYRANYTWADGVLAVLLLSAECFIMVHGIGYTVNILRSRIKARDLDGLATAIPLEPLPSVAILIPARHEPRHVLTETFITVHNIDYANKTIYFLDDSVEETYRKEAEELAREYHLKLFRRTKPWHGAKAGIVNDCLAQLQEKYVVIFDADQNPMPDFLGKLVALMRSNEKLAFVQTPQFYSNTETNAVARASVLQQAVFYEYICEGKGVADAMFCCGTNVIFRREALQSVGGMDESSVTEDFATSIRLHAAGYDSLYYNHVCAFGMGPEDLIAYFKQQFRWAAGTLSVFKKVLGRFLTKPFSLRAGQWLEYFLSSSYYFVGCAFFILMLCPLVYIFFDVPSFFANPAVYFLSFLPYIVLSTSVFYFALRKRRYKAKDLVLGQLLGATTFAVYMKAAAAALLGFKISFGVTPKLKGGAVPYRLLWPQLAVLAVNWIACVWAVNRFVYEHQPALIVNAFWAFYHFLIFSSIFYFNENHG